MDPTPQQTPPPKITGTLKYSCCGQQRTIQGEGLSLVTCQQCQITYDLELRPRELAPALLPPGITVTITEPIATVLGCDQRYTLTPGQYLTGIDLHGVMGTLDGQVLVQVEKVGMDGQMRCLLAPVPMNKVQIKEGSENGVSDTQAKDTQHGQEANSGQLPFNPDGRPDAGPKDPRGQNRGGNLTTRPREGKGRSPR